MSLAQLGILLAWVLAATVVWASFLYGIPLLSRLIFVSRVQGIRDDCMDAVLDGRLRDSRGVRHVLYRLETLSQHAGQITRLRTRLIPEALLPGGVTDITQAAQFGCSLSEREFLRELDVRLSKATVSLMRRTSALDNLAAVFYAMVSLSGVRGRQHGRFRLVMRARQLAHVTSSDVLDLEPAETGEPPTAGGGSAAASASFGSAPRGTLEQRHRLETL